MGANIVRRLQLAGHQCVAYDHNPDAARALTEFGAIAATSLRIW
jgi:6-phosphogluconate dehydrogenase